MADVGKSLGGAASGAATGAKLGSVVPGVGNLVGALVGGLLGLFGSGGLSEEEQQKKLAGLDPIEFEQSLPQLAKTIAAQPTVRVPDSQLFQGAPPIKSFNKEFEQAPDPRGVPGLRSPDPGGQAKIASNTVSKSTGRAAAISGRRVPGVEPKKVQALQSRKDRLRSIGQVKLQSQPQPQQTDTGIIDTNAGFDPTRIQAGDIQRTENQAVANRTFPQKTAPVAKAATKVAKAAAKTTPAAKDAVDTTNAAKEGAGLDTSDMLQIGALGAGALAKLLQGSPEPARATSSLSPIQFQQQDLMALINSLGGQTVKPQL